MTSTSILRRLEVPRRDALKKRRKRLIGKMAAIVLGAASFMMSIGATPAHAGTVTYGGCIGGVSQAMLVNLYAGATAVETRQVAPTSCYRQYWQTIRVTTTIWGWNPSLGRWMSDNQRVDTVAVPPGYVMNVPELPSKYYTILHPKVYIEWFVGSAKVGWERIDYTNPTPGTDYLCGMVGCQIVPQPLPLGAYMRRA